MGISSNHQLKVLFWIVAAILLMAAIIFFASSSFSVEEVLWNISVNKHCVSGVCAW